MFKYFIVTVTKSKPQNLTVSNVTSRSITITWLAPIDGEDGITNYNLFYSHDNNTFVKLLANTYIFTIANLSKYITILKYSKHTILISFFIMENVYFIVF